MGKKFNRWLMKKMGNLYVKLDHTLEYEKGPILSLDIDEDFENIYGRSIKSSDFPMISKILFTIVILSISLFPEILYD